MKFLWHKQALRDKIPDARNDFSANCGSDCQSIVFQRQNDELLH